MKIIFKKRLLCLSAVVLLVMGLGTEKANAQLDKDPATWGYSIRKVSGNNYNILVRCIVESPWHIYSQVQTKDFIGTATKFSFAKVPGLKLVGKVMESGKKSKFENKEVGIVNWEMEGTVIFMQKAVIDPSVKVVKGSVTYQTCTHERCLTEKTVNFSIPVK